ncbi:MAG TPA: tetratricopeptide repeat protein, partial [Blastocatellia bacterium]|nr:tetratricopeptide repeat protein [Blastocatellia bacterium]
MKTLDGILTNLIVLSLLLPLVPVFTQAKPAGQRDPQTDRNKATEAAQTPPIVLTAGTEVEQTIKRNQTQRYSLHADKGQLISLHLEQEGVDSKMALIGPDGSVKDRIESLTGSVGPVVLESIAETSGDYTATVQANSALRGAHYRLLANIRAAGDRDIQRIGAQRATVAALDMFEKRDPNSASKFESAASVWHDVGDGYNEGTCFLMAGVVYRNMADPDDALKNDQRALAIFRSSNTARMEAYTLNNIGQIYYSLENIEG